MGRNRVGGVRAVTSGGIGAVLTACPDRHKGPLPAPKATFPRVMGMS